MPGKILLVDTKLGSIIGDEQLKCELSMKQPVSKWINQHLKTLPDFYECYLDEHGQAPDLISKDRTSPQMGGLSVETDRRMPLFGYSVEDLNMLILPMLRDGYDLLYFLHTFLFTEYFVDFASQK